MRYVIRIIRRILSKDEPTPLGRWNIENCTRKMNYKVDLSNEDHCGPCGHHEVKKIEFEKEVKPKQKGNKVN
jgi:hypothetical protein